MGSKKVTYEMIKNYINSEETGNGCELITTEEEFEKEKIKNDKNNTTVKLKIRCKCKNEYSTNFTKFKFRNKKQCNDCGHEILSMSKRQDGDKIIQLFVENNKIPLFKSEEYMGERQKLPFICNKHKELGTQYTTYDSLRSGHEGCRLCRYKGSIYKGSNIIIQNVIDAGYLPMFDNNFYKNNDTLLPIVCPNHVDKGIIFSRIYNIKNQRACKWCGIEKISGENCYAWKGGISTLIEYFRKLTIPWKKECLKSQKYCCALTRRNNVKLEIHHLYSFSNMVYEALDELKIPTYQTINKYTNEELELIENKIKEIHNSHNDGIVLNKIIHKLFHDLYKRGDNNNEQFKEFIIRLEQGEFSDFLKENNLELNINHELLNNLL